MRQGRTVDHMHQLDAPKQEMKLHGTCVESLWVKGAATYLSLRDNPRQEAFAQPKQGW